MVGSVSHMGIKVKDNSRLYTRRWITHIRCARHYELATVPPATNTCPLCSALPRFVRFPTMLFCLCTVSYDLRTRTDFSRHTYLPRDLSSVSFLHLKRRMLHTILQYAHSPRGSAHSPRASILCDAHAFDTDNPQSLHRS
jgi:hypothetical protein